MSKLWRLLLIAAAVSLTAGAGGAAAQTVMARNVPAGMDVEVLLNEAVVAKAPAGADGVVTIDLKLPEPGELDANIYVDACEKSRRVLVVDRNKRPPSPPAGCDRREVSGLFLVTRVNTLVVDVGALQPSMLLVKGKYTPPKPVAEGEEDAPSAHRPSPTGLSLFAAGGHGKFRDAFAIACGNAACDGHDGGLGYSFGGTFWFTRWLAAEGGYLKSRRTTAKGGDATFSFDSTFDVDVFPVVAKIGIPGGPFRPFGFIGAAYHQSTLTSSETIDAKTQSFSQHTHGWGPTFGGGAEGWVTSKVAIFGEFNVTKVKGDAEDGGEGRVDDRLRFFGFGIRIRLSR